MNYFARPPPPQSERVPRLCIRAHALSVEDNCSRKESQHVGEPKEEQSRDNEQVGQTERGSGGWSAAEPPMGWLFSDPPIFSFEVEGTFSARWAKKRLGLLFEASLSETTASVPLIPD